jgi:hypothetical protein
MTKVVIVGEIYNAGLEVGGGPIMPGGSPSHPWVPPSPGAPSHPWVPPQPGVPTHPIAGPPPGYWGGVAPPYPDQGLPGQPPGYWGGGNVPMPTPPIYLPPVVPGGPPVTIWPSPGHPAHPIVTPPLPPAPDGEAVKLPPEDGGWGYAPGVGWGYFPSPGQPGPKA